jgi:hypothetical protein
MTTRIREQLERVADLKTRCTLTISTVPVELPPDAAAATHEQQIQIVTARVTQMVMKAVDRKHPSATKAPESN